VGALVAALGTSPVAAYSAILRGALGTPFNIGQTVMIAALLILTGLAAAIPFSARLWNIGGEGQMYFGAIVAAGIGINVPAGWPRWIAVPVVLTCSALGGALWGWVPGWLKARFDASEMIVSLMMNFVAITLATYVITDLWPQGFAPQTEYVAANATLPLLLPGTLVNLGVVIALVATVIAWVVMTRTPLGFSIQAVGANARASRLAGIKIGRVTVACFALAGAFAGLAGAIVVQGISRALVADFSGSFGFIGIAVALLARLKPAWILPSALFFAIMRVGSNSLQASTGLSPTIGEVLVATFVVLLMVMGVIRLRYAEAVS
jgi:simple sugar transport system permease protein